MQQGNPLGHLIFEAWVLHKVVSAIDVMSALIYFSKHGSWMVWYWLVRKSSVLRALSILEEYGPPLGILVNLSKCELLAMIIYKLGIPASMRTSHLPPRVILGAPP